MATKFNLIGIDKIEMGDVGPGDTMGTVLVAYPDILEGSATFDLVPADTTDINLEDSSDPFVSIFGSKTKMVEFTILGLAMADLPKFQGGTFVAGTGGTKDTWTEAENDPYIFQSLAITTKNREGDAIVMKFPKMQVIAAISEAPTKTAAAGVRFKMLKNKPMSIEGATVA